MRFHKILIDGALAAGGAVAVLAGLPAVASADAVTPAWHRISWAAGGAVVLVLVVVGLATLLNRRDRRHERGFGRHQREDDG